MAARGGGKVADARTRKRERDAARKRAARKSARVARAAELLRAEGIEPPPLRVDAVNPFDDVVVDVPVMETAPVDGPGADAFAPEPAPVVDGAPPPSPEPPLVAPPSPPPPPPEPTPEPRRVVTDAEVMPLALVIGAFFQGGANALLRKRPDVRTSIAEALASSLAPGSPVDPLLYVPAVGGFVSQSVVEVCKRWGIRLPYMHEIIVAGAIGVGTFGFIVKAAPDAAHTERPRVAAPVEPAPRPPEAPAASSSTTTNVPPIPEARGAEAVS